MRMLPPGFLVTALRRTEDALSQVPQATPHYVDAGSWVQVPVDEPSSWRGETYDHGNWTSGFWTGVLLELEALGAPGRRVLAAQVARATAARAGDGTTHDIGFMFAPSACLLHDQTADPAWRRVGEQAAETLAARFRPAGGYLQAFGALDDPRAFGTSTVDTMMNLPLLWWGAREGRADLRVIAEQHADATAAAIVRPDGSTYHLVRFSARGEVVHQGTFQGLSSTSCWSRGQAWAVHGFVAAVIETGEERYAEVAERCLEFFCSRAPLDALAPYDLLQPSPHHDAAALAIVASGLAEALAVPELAERLGARARLDEAVATLMREAAFFGEVGIVGRSAYSVPHGLGVDGALPYGDYYFLRALRLGGWRAS